MSRAQTQSLCAINVMPCISKLTVHPKGHAHLPNICHVHHSDSRILPIPLSYKGISESKIHALDWKQHRGQGLSFIHLWILSIYYKAQYLADKCIIWFINQSYVQIPMKTEPNRKQKSSEITKKQIIHKLDNQTLKWLKTAFIILSASISNTKHFSTNIIMSL